MKENDNAYTYISIVAIVAIVSLFVMFAGSGSKETSQPIVLTSNLGGDVLGDARKNILLEEMSDTINSNLNLIEMRDWLYDSCFIGSFGNCLVVYGINPLEDYNQENYIEMIDYCTLLAELACLGPWLEFHSYDITQDFH